MATENGYSRQLSAAVQATVELAYEIVGIAAEGSL
jgi:hypothetical protein